MRKSSVLLGVISAASILCAAWSGWQLHAARETILVLEHRLADSASSAPRPLVAGSPVVARSPPASPSSVAASTAAAGAVDSEAAREKQVRQQIRASQQRERELMRDPAYRKSRIDDWRHRYAQTRADAIRVVGLTPDQADRLIELSIERNMRSVDLVEYPGEAPSAAAQAELKRLAEAYQTDLRELLGEEKFERWNWYQASSGERGEVSLFRAQLSTTTEPLQDRQADALVEALYAERQRRSREYEEYATAAGITNRNIVSPQDRQRWLDLEKDANQRIHDSMSGNLTRAQLESLDEMLTANVAPVEAALRLQLEGKLAKSN